MHLLPIQISNSLNLFDLFLAVKNTMAVPGRVISGHHMSIRLVWLKQKLSELSVFDHTLYEWKEPNR